MKTSTNVTMIMFSIMILFNSCTKKGDQGTPGKDGNANVISSNTVTLSSWAVGVDDGINYSYTSTITWSSITQAIKDKGAVMIYVQNGSDWIALPTSDISKTQALSINFLVSTGSVVIECTGYDNSGSPGASSFNGLVVRIVVIPASGIRRLTENHIDIKNYQMVKSCFDVQDK